MASFRFGQVARAASEGLALFAAKRAEDERRQSERAWQLQLENIRESRAQARSDEDFYRRMAMATRNEVLSMQREERQNTRADARAQADRTSRENIAKEARGARREEFFYEMVSRRRSELQRTLTALNDAEAEQLEATKFNPEQRTAIEEQFEEERDRLIGSFAMSMMDEADRNPDIDAFAPYRVRNQDDLQYIFETAGMGQGAAKARAADMWKWQSDPGADAGAGEQGEKWEPEMQPHLFDESGNITGSNPAYVDKYASDQAPPQPEPQTSTPPASSLPPVMNPQSRVPQPGPTDPSQLLFDDQPWARTRAFGEEFRRRLSQVPVNDQDLYGPAAIEAFSAYGSK